MLFRIAVVAALAFVSAAPASHDPHGYCPFPLADGFPNPSAGQLAKIERAAGGSLPNGGLPTKLSAAATVTLQLIAAQEIFEVAYFNSLLNNVTSNAKGFQLKGSERNYAIKTFTEIRAQEELHAIGANAILANAGEEPIKPCMYQFPTSNYLSAVSLAGVFTDVVLSVLPGAQVTFAQDGGDEVGLVQLIGSIIAQEGEQDGYFRSVQGKVPSAAPFLTGSNPAFAFTALNMFLVPGSCPNLGNVYANIPVFPALNVISTGKAPWDTTATFSVKGAINTKTQSLAYLTGQNVPVVVPITKTWVSRGVTYFNAALPFSTDGFAQGLSVAAVVNGNSFATAADVAGATAFGPGLVEVL